MMTGPGLLPFVRRWWWLLLAGAVAAGGVAWVVASQAQRTYEAETKLLVGPVSADYPTLQASGALARTYAELAHSRRVVEPAARKARIRLTRKQVEKAVSATSNDVTRIIEVKVRHTDPAAAARMANSVAGALIALRRHVPAQDSDPAEEIMRDPGVERLGRDQRRVVRAAVIDAVGSPNAGNLEVIERATRPRDPVAPRIRLLVGLAALAGVLAAAVFAMVKEGLTKAPEERDPFADFDIDSLLQPRDPGPATKEDWEPGSVVQGERWEQR